MTLQIGAQIYIGQAQLRAPVGNEADGFEAAVNAALVMMRSTGEGNDLLGAIEGARHEVLIVKAAQGKSNTCVMAQQTEAACDAACYQEVISQNLLYGKIQDLLNRNMIRPEHPAVAKFQKFYVGKQYKANLRRLDGIRQEVPVAHKTFPEGHNTDRSLKRKVEGFDRKFDDRDVIVQGMGKVRYLQNGLVGYHIMNHLTVGQGTGAWVVWDPLLTNAGADLPTDQRSSWMERPPWIALAHELIHGWRLATGRCVFRPSVSGGDEEYYEEAMTVGLPPYDHCRFTENRFRRHKGLPLRAFYGETTRSQTARATNKHGAVGSRVMIKVVGSGPDDSLVFSYYIRSALDPDHTIKGKTDGLGQATAQVSSDSEIRFRGFGAFGRVETQWQKIEIGKYMTLQFGRYRYICEPL